MRIIDQPDQRLLSGNLGEERQHAHADQETVCRGPSGPAKRRIQRLALRGRQQADPVQERHQHPVQRGEGQPQLRFQPGDADRPHAVSSLRRVLQQTGLANARLTEDHQRPAQALADRFHQLIQRLAIIAAAHQNVRDRGLSARKGPGPLVAITAPPGHDSARAEQRDETLTGYASTATIGSSHRQAELYSDLRRTQQIRLTRRGGTVQARLRWARCGNSRNDTTAKTVLTDVEAADLAVPRDCKGSFEPRIVRKGQTRLAGFNNRIIAL